MFITRPSYCGIIIDSGIRQTAGAVHTYANMCEHILRILINYKYSSLLLFYTICKRKQISIT